MKKASARYENRLTGATETNSSKATGGGRAWYAWAAILAAVAALNVALILYSPEGEGEPDASTFSAAPGGAKALYTLLRERGGKVSRKNSSMRIHPPKSSALVVLSPVVPFDQEELFEVKQWLASGGVMILGSDNRWALSAFGVEAGIVGADALFSALEPGGADELEKKRKKLRLYSSSPSPVSGGVAKIDPPPVVSIAGAGLNTIPHLRAGDDTIAAERRVGKGGLIVFTFPSALSNGNIRKGDNLGFVLNTIEAAGRGREIIFDEYHHGHVSAEWTGRMGFFKLLFVTPYGLAALLVFLGAVLWLFNRDTISVREAGQYVQKPSSLDHINAVAVLHEKLNAHQYAAESLMKQFTREIAAKYQQDGGLEKSLAALAAAAPRISPADIGAVLAVDKKLRSGASPDAVETLRLARSVETIRRELRK